jgi:hypothetical protein
MLFAVLSKNAAIEASISKNTLIDHLYNFKTRIANEVDLYRFWRWRYVKGRFAYNGKISLCFS